MQVSYYTYKMKNLYLKDRCYKKPDSNEIVVVNNFNRCSSHLQPHGVYRLYNVAKLVF